MIPLDKLKEFKEGDLVIYEAPTQPRAFYSGRVIKQPDGITNPRYLRVVPTDRRLPPIPLAGDDGKALGKSGHLVRELAYGWGIAFRVSEEDLTKNRDISQDLRAQVEGTDSKGLQALDYLLEQLDEIRSNFEPSMNQIDSF